MRLATWNVNSVRQREGHVRRFLDRVQPDLLLLQEIKCEAAAFPGAAFEALGYGCAVHGQKAYNGVAILSRVPGQEVHRALPGLPADDAQARYLEIMAGALTVINIYLPNGNSGGEGGFAYKLRWMDCLIERARQLLDEEADFIIAGDFNVCPDEVDAAPGALPATDALVRPESRARWRSLVWLGLTDAVRALQPAGPAYTFWDYQAGAWPRDRGLRIDHALLSPRVAERLTMAVPERRERGEDQPSDHVPVLIEV